MNGWEWLLGTAAMMGALGVLLFAGIVAGLRIYGAAYPCAPADLEDDDAWDRGHDEWVDRGNEVL